MSRFTSSFTKETDFDGDRITYRMNRLSRRDFLTMIPESGVSEDEGKISFSTDSLLKNLDTTLAHLEKYVLEFTGLVIDEEPITRDVFFKSYAGMAYFTPLIDHMIGDLIRESSVKEEEGKKPASPSEKL